MYLGGYVVECDLKALLCAEARVTDWRQHSSFGQVGGHDLNALAAATRLDGAAAPRSRSRLRELLRRASVWAPNRLRYSSEPGQGPQTERFIQDVEALHRLLVEEVKAIASRGLR